MRRNHAILIACLVIGGTLVAWLLVRRVTRPLARLIEVTDAVAKGRLSHRISIRASDELELLAQSLNRMLDRLDATTISRDYLTHILRSMSEALVVLSLDGRIMLANPAMSRLVGHGEGELGGMLFERILAPGRPAADLLGRLRREGSLDQVETYYTERGGRPVAVLVSGALMWDPDGSLAGMLCIAQDDRERRRQQEQVRRLAYFDSTTGLPNRVHFHLTLERALAAAARREHRLAVLFLDLDHFKLINDTLGHATGDRLLLRFAERLQSCLRSGDTVTRLDAAEGSTVARLGGDEFTILLSHIESRDDAIKVAERILEALTTPFDLNGHEIVVDSSMGIAVFPDDGEEPQSLLMHADAAMYEAKAQGRAGFQTYRQELDGKNLERLTLEGDLRKAIEREQLHLLFQPQLDLRTDEVVSVEALLRWRHPGRGCLLPGAFIPLAEETGLMVPIGDWVLRSSCRQARTWLERGLKEVKVAVNISRRQLWRPDFVDRVARILAETGLPARLLELEITESIALADPDAIVDTLSRLRSMGVQLTLDDFGTGYSSLNHLKAFPLDRLKIDGSFIREVARNAADAEIVHAIIALAHKLKFAVVAESVESDEQLAMLCFHHCDQAQGLLISPPLPADEITAWLEARRSREEGLQALPA
jgi:diguanylate cyclase (GGDEF)-like protein/PAS domain S-box-containing protein